VSRHLLGGGPVATGSARSLHGPSVSRRLFTARDVSRRRALLAQRYARGGLARGVPPVPRPASSTALLRPLSHLAPLSYCRPAITAARRGNQWQAPRCCQVSLPEIV